MAKNSSAQVFFSFILCIALLFTGCTSPQYQLVKEADYQPPIPLDIHARDEQLDAGLLHLIAYRTPGSWKRDALWDEYVFEIHNHSEVPVQLVNLVLIDPLDAEISPSRNIWHIQKKNPETLRHYKKAGIPVTKDVDPAVLIGATAFVVAAEIGTAAAVSAAVTAGGYASLYALGAVTFVVLPAALIVGGGTALKNKKAKKLINEEFQNRSLRLRTTLTARNSVRGSLFYPMIPNPKSFKLSYYFVDAHSLPGDPVDILTLEGPLVALKGLHVLGEPE